MIKIDSRFRGPLGMTNGGMAAGMLAEDLDGPTQVRLERPVPYSTALESSSRGTTTTLLHDDAPVAVASPLAEPFSPPPFIAPEKVLDFPRWNLDEALYADCFVCGRPAPDGLGIELRRVGKRLSAAVWTPSTCDAIHADTVPNRFLWGALDCPGGYASLAPTSTLGLLGSLGVDIRFQPDSDEAVVVVGEGGAVDGRKFSAGTAIYTTEGELVAAGSAIWIAFRAAA
jgi:hypothetical protein